jgi:hypothetical protein
MVRSDDTLCPRGVVTWLRFAQTNSTKRDEVGCVFDKAETKVSNSRKSLKPRNDREFQIALS